MNEWTGTWRKAVQTNSEPDTASWPSASFFNSNLRDRHAEWIGRNERENAREKGSLPMSKHTLFDAREGEKTKYILPPSKCLLGTSHECTPTCMDTPRRAALLAFSLLRKHSLSLLMCCTAVHMSLPEKAWLMLRKPWHLVKLRRRTMCIQLMHFPEQWEPNKLDWLTGAFLWVIQRLFSKGLMNPWPVWMGTQRSTWLATCILPLAEATEISTWSRAFGVQETWDQVPFLSLTYCVALLTVGG